MYYLVVIIDEDDFGNGPYELTFDSGGATQCQLVPIRTDDLIEDVEAFQIAINLPSSPPPLVGVTVATRTILIFDSTGIFYVH